jgi:hypothetical protein
MKSSTSYLSIPFYDIHGISQLFYLRRVWNEKMKKIPVGFLIVTLLLITPSLAFTSHICIRNNTLEDIKVKFRHELCPEEDETITSGMSTRSICKQG